MAALTSGTFTSGGESDCRNRERNRHHRERRRWVPSAIDPNSANNTATVSDSGGRDRAGLTVTNVASPNPVQAGSTITYTQVVTNTGTTAVTGATFTETDRRLRI